jgi:hypothetical protein
VRWMRIFVWLALVLPVATHIAGCSDSGPGKVAVTWVTLTAATDGSPIATSCPAGATSAVIFATPEGSAEPSNELQVRCGDEEAVIGGLAVGRYTIAVRLTDGAGTTRYAESTGQIIDVAEVGTATSEQFQIYVDHGFYELSRNLRPPGSAGPVSCADALVDGEGVVIRVTDAGGEVYETFLVCEDGLAPNITMTRPIPSGAAAYSIDVTVEDVFGSVKASAETILPSEAGPLEYGNMVQDLGSVDIDSWQ